MTKYTILINNKHTDKHTYVLFSDNTDVEADSGLKKKPEAYRSVYLKSALVNSGAAPARFAFAGDFYAITGTSPDISLDTNVLVTTTEFKKVALKNAGSKGSQVTMALSPGGGASFVGDPTATVDNTGAYSIKTSDSIKKGDPHYPFIGLGAMDPHPGGTVIPIVACPVDHSTTYTFYPTPRYYVAVGDHVKDLEKGIILGADTISGAILIDFTNKEQTIANVTHQPDGSYSVKYTLE